tara:strand:- start:859 stop:1284 length:426 start_codon:yes stop_codon:yes gene_type:complete
MIIGTEENHIEIVELERAPDGVPNAGDLRVLISIKLREFAGKYDSVWIEEPTFHDFIKTLETVEKSRNGAARLESCSPDELTIEIRSRDSHGHFVAIVSLSRYQYSGPTYWKTSVSGGFELDPSSLPIIVNSFKKLYSGGG